MASKNLSITVNDGKKRVPITNLEGDEIGVFYFSPTDTGIINRVNEATQRIDEIANKLSADNGEGAPSDEAFAEATKGICDAIDYLFGGNASEAFFGSVNPLSVIDGEFYIVSVIDAVSEFIASQMGTEIKKVEKYTKKYSK